MPIRDKTLVAGVLVLMPLGIAVSAMLMLHLVHRHEGDTAEPAEMAKPVEGVPRPYCVQGPDGPQESFCPISLNHPDADTGACFGDDMICLGRCLVCARKIDGTWRQVSGWVEPRPAPPKPVPGDASR